LISLSFFSRLSLLLILSCNSPTPTYPFVPYKFFLYLLTILFFSSLYCPFNNFLSLSFFFFFFFCVILLFDTLNHLYLFYQTHLLYLLSFFLKLMHALPHPFPLILFFPLICKSFFTRFFMFLLFGCSSFDYLPISSYTPTRRGAHQSEAYSSSYRMWTSRRAERVRAVRNATRTGGRSARRESSQRSTTGRSVDRIPTAAGPPTLE